MRPASLNSLSLIVWLTLLIIIQKTQKSSSLPAESRDQVQGSQVFEGDILLDRRLQERIQSESDDSLRRRKRQAYHSKFRAWKHAVVPYILSPKLGKRARIAIKHAMSIIEENSCVMFTLRLAQPDYVEFINGEGCYSAIGRTGGRQVLSIGSGCELTRLVLHELLHTLGYFHEHTRYDRDFYIEVLWWNIQEGADKNFISHHQGFDSSSHYPYDFNSILHYGSREFSKNGGRTIRSITKPGQEVGSRGTLSLLDIKKLNDHYKCYRKRSKRLKLLRECKDKLRSCKSFATFKRYCQKQKMFALLYCPRTCGLCS